MGGGCAKGALPATDPRGDERGIEAVFVSHLPRKRVGGPDQEHLMIEIELVQVHDASSS